VPEKAAGKAGKAAAKGWVAPLAPSLIWTGAVALASRLAIGKGDDGEAPAFAPGAPRNWAGRPRIVAALHVAALHERAEAVLALPGCGMAAAACGMVPSMSWPINPRPQVPLEAGVVVGEGARACRPISPKLPCLSSCADGCAGGECGTMAPEVGEAAPVAAPAAERD